MLKKPPAAAWERIHAASYLSIPNCWEKCGGGFCCNNRHELVRFRAIPQGQQSFPMLEDEFIYLRENGFLAPEMITSARVMSVTLPNGKTASARMVTCRQKGRCFSVDKRPLICKIYPFIPVPGEDGSITGFELGSVFDEMFHLAGLPSPCAVLEEDSAKLKAELAEKIGFIFEMPYFIFYFSAFTIIAQHLRTRFAQQYSGDPSADYPAFFREFELLYMGGKLFSAETIREQLQTLYTSLERRYGEFEI